MYLIPLHISLFNYVVDVDVFFSSWVEVVLHILHFSALLLNNGVQCDLLVNIGWTSGGLERNLLFYEMGQFLTDFSRGFPPAV